VKPDNPWLRLKARLEEEQKSPGLAEERRKAMLRAENERRAQASIRVRSGAGSGMNGELV